MLYTKTKKKSIVLYNEGGPGGPGGGGGGVSSSPSDDNWFINLFSFLFLGL